jgi:hypothetical protein
VLDRITKCALNDLPTAILASEDGTGPGGVERRQLDHQDLTSFGTPRVMLQRSIVDTVSSPGAAIREPTS